MDKARILIVEDEAIVAESIARMLKISGYTCSIASCAEEAIDKARAENPDLILMDILLSGKEDGITTAEEIHSRSLIPIVYLTALSDEATLERAKLTGPYGYIIKPFNARELIHTIEIALYKHSMEKKLRESETKYRSIFENAIEGIFQNTPGGKLITVNPALVRILGYESPEELISTITDIGQQVYVDPEKRDEILRMLEDQGYVSDFEMEHYRKDRSIIWVSVSARAVKDERGNILYIEGTLEDITHRKEAELQIKESLNKLEKATGAIINVIVNAVEMRDPYTAGHQKRVGNLAWAMAMEMGLSIDRIDGIHMAGAIHDLGKIAIPAEILSMPRILTDIEHQLVQHHSQAGYNILKDIQFPWPIASIILQHHERIDGSGYPQGLKDGEILLEAKIIAVADVVEAIASHRPYRPAHGIDAALKEITRNKGILYDREAADACIRLFREKGFTLHD
ncbi:MAG: histidine kinase [Syntrophus sp. (in: bacteria)]|nr:histidine kinase [Syntrophus sp. (in: bacteria)]